jgi:hypothetical protein
LFTAKEECLLQALEDKTGGTHRGKKTNQRKQPTSQRTHRSRELIEIEDDTGGSRKGNEEEEKEEEKNQMTTCTSLNPDHSLDSFVCCRKFCIT